MAREKKECKRKRKRKEKGCFEKNKNKRRIGTLRARSSNESSPSPWILAPDPALLRPPRLEELAFVTPVPNPFMKIVCAREGGPLIGAEVVLEKALSLPLSEPTLE